MTRPRSDSATTWAVSLAVGGPGCAVKPPVAAPISQVTNKRIRTRRFMVSSGYEQQRVLASVRHFCLRSTPMPRRPPWPQRPQRPLGRPSAGDRCAHPHNRRAPAHGIVSVRIEASRSPPAGSAWASGAGTVESGSSPWPPPHRPQRSTVSVQGRNANGPSSRCPTDGATPSNHISTQVVGYALCELRVVFPVAQPNRNHGNPRSFLDFRSVSASNCVNAQPKTRQLTT